MSDEQTLPPHPPVLLYVEDEVLIHPMVIDAFHAAGLKVLVACCAAEAIAMLEDTDQPIGGLITDINLNTRLSGWDVARAGRAVDHNLPVIYVSGASGHRWKAEGVIGSTMMTKPFDPSMLVKAMVEQLRHRAAIIQNLDFC